MLGITLCTNVDAGLKPQELGNANFSELGLRQKDWAGMMRILLGLQDLDECSDDLLGGKNWANAEYFNYNPLESNIVALAGT